MRRKTTPDILVFSQLCHRANSPPLVILMIPHTNVRQREDR